MEVDFQADVAQHCCSCVAFPLAKKFSLELNASALGKKYTAIFNLSH